MKKSGEYIAKDALDLQEKTVGAMAATSTEAEAGRDNDDEKIYPPMKKVIPAMLAIYLVFFLVALV